MQSKKKHEKILWILYRSKDAVTKDFYQNEAKSDMFTSETLVNGKRPEQKADWKRSEGKVQLRLTAGTAESNTEITNW